MKEHIQSAKVVAINVCVTFVQAALAVLAVNNWDFSNKTVIAGAVGAGASAVWNLTIKPLLKANGLLYSK